MESWFTWYAVMSEIKQLLLGPEIGEKKRHIQELIHKIKQDTGIEPEIVRFYPGEKDLLAFLGEVSNGSLFSDHRVFILERVDEHSRAAQIKALAETLKNPPDNTTLILTSDKNSIDKKISALFSKDNKINFWEMFEGAKKNWIQGFFRQRKIQVHQDALEELLDMVDNNTSEMRTACETLLFYFSEGSTITVDDIDRILYHSKEENVFTLFEKVAVKDLEGALEVFSKIRLSQQSEVVQLFSGMLWQMKQLLSLSIMKDRGYNQAECWKELKIYGKKKQKSLWSALGRYRTVELQRGISLIAYYDQQARSIRKEMQDRVMESFLYRFIKGRPLDFD